MFDVFFLLGAGIGNVIEALYAVEYCLADGDLRVGVYLHKVNRSFEAYLKSCYGEVIVESLANVRCRHLIQSFCVEDRIPIPHEHYFYVKPDYHSCQYHSETEQYLSIATALYPGGEEAETLRGLTEDWSERVRKTGVENKTVLYPGGSASMSARRWPHYEELIRMLGDEKVLIVGSKEDFDFQYSYVYPLWFAKWAVQALLNRRVTWQTLKRLGLLRKHAHLSGRSAKPNVFIEHFTWPELVALFRRCRRFVGNDGGLMHLAAACGANGVAIFGPTSAAKNRPLNWGMRTLARNMPCQPCQFGVGNIQLMKDFINCPFGVKCLNEIAPAEVLEVIRAAELQGTASESVLDSHHPGRDQCL